jgi:hypothetical protein
LESSGAPAFLHRKNSLFYKTENGAEVGDLFMSLIHTCELNNTNPFDYLTELQKHSAELAKNPAAWMPWTYARRWGALRLEWILGKRPLLQYD